MAQTETEVQITVNVARYFRDAAAKAAAAGGYKNLQEFIREKLRELIST